jgi:hypothetical protein
VLALDPQHRFLEALMTTETHKISDAEIAIPTAIQRLDGMIAGKRTWLEKFGGADRRAKRADWEIEVYQLDLRVLERIRSWLIAQQERAEGETS